MRQKAICSGVAPERTTPSTIAYMLANPSDDATASARPAWGCCMSDAARAVGVWAGKVMTKDRTRGE
jgi:hypothetical protein